MGEGGMLCLCETGRVGGNSSFETQFQVFFHAFLGTSKELTFENDQTRLITAIKSLM